jgi:hypothetical protein
LRAGIAKPQYQTNQRQKNPNPGTRSDHNFLLRKTQMIGRVQVPLWPTLTLQRTERLSPGALLLANECRQPCFSDKYDSANVIAAAPTRASGKRGGPGGAAQKAGMRGLATRRGFTTGDNPHDDMVTGRLSL